MAEPRQKTAKEIQDEFITCLWRLVDYWDKVKDHSSRERLSGLVFSILNLCDGTSSGMGCSLLLVPTCHPTDPDTHREEGENWYPVNEKVQEIMEAEISCGKMLHETFFDHPASRL